MDTYLKAQIPVDLFDRRPATSFGHLLLPSVTAEVGSNPEKGFTRLCFPFFQAHREPDPEAAIAALRALTWFLALRID